MQIIKAKDYDDMSKKAASIILSQVVMKNDSILGLATGSTPIGLYDYLGKWYKEGLVDFKDVISVNLDEYKGLGEKDDQSYVYFMREHLFSKVNIKASYLPNGLENDGEKACREYENKVKELGGQDLQLLGLGHDGHIGFNEPGDSFIRDTHEVVLNPITIEANKRFFKTIDDVPKKAYTMGIGTIMKAKKILVVVSGKDKAKTLKDVVMGPVTPKCQASILQFHRDCIIVADEEALSDL